MRSLDTNPPLVKGGQGKSDEQAMDEAVVLTGAVGFVVALLGLAVVVVTVTAIIMWIMNAVN